MGITITGKLNNTAQTFQAGDSTGFGIRLGVQFYNRKTKQKEWTNYQAAVFTNNQNKINFLTNALVQGAIVEINAKTQFIDGFDGNNGRVEFIQLNDCDLGYIGTPEAAQQPQQNQQAPQQQPQQQYQQPQQQQGQQPVNNNFDDFNDDINF